MTDQGAIETDVVVIGAGPVGLFAVFELGLLEMSCHVVDTLTRPGGQCAELYPEKPIYDIPGIPVVTGQELTERLMTQVRPFAPAFSLGHQVESLRQLEDGRWELATSQGLRLLAPVVVIAAGGGSFVPKRPPIPGIEQYEGRSVFYAVRQMSAWRDRTLVVAGGGDSALDWTLALQPIVRQLTLVHRRREFRASPDTVRKVMALVESGGIGLHVAELLAFEGDAGALRGVRLRSDVAGEFVHPCDLLLPFYGLTMKLGPIAGFGLNLHENRIAVDTEKFETSVPSIFAIGDINVYPGKLKLILSGFHEAALMAQAAFRYCRPGAKLRFQYTTSSSSLQQRLGRN
jgi:thioredoxin reductase (NADPH)